MKPGVCLSLEDLLVKKIPSWDERVELRNQEGLFAKRPLVRGEILPYRMLITVDNKRQSQKFDARGFDLNKLLRGPDGSFETLCGTAMPPYGDDSSKINDFRLDVSEEAIRDTERMKREKKKRANCRFYITNYNGEPMVHIQMTKPIAAGQELLLDYGKRYWMNWKKVNGGTEEAENEEENDGKKEKDKKEKRKVESEERKGSKRRTRADSQATGTGITKPPKKRKKMEEVEEEIDMQNEDRRPGELRVAAAAYVVSCVVCVLCL